MLGKVQLSNSTSTTWEEVKRAVLSTIALEDIVELRAFGSAVRPLTTYMVTKKEPSGFLGLFEREVPHTITQYPNDIDVLVLTKSKPTRASMEVPVHANFLRYSESCGYGFSYPSSGYREGILHVTLMTKAHWKKAIKNGDPDALRIDRESILF